MNMKAVFILCLLLFNTNFSVCQGVISDAKSNDHRSGFIENKGQIIDQNNKPNPAVLYLLNTPGMNVQLRKTGFSYDVYSIEYKPNPHYIPSNNQHFRKPNPENDSLLAEYHFHRIDIDLQNANPNPVIEASASSKDYLNYYTTGTPEEGVTLVKSFGGITYKNVYSGIDLQFTGNDGVFEYNFLIQPGADIATIQLKVAGPERIKTFKEKIQMVTSVGDIDEIIPLCYYSLNNIQVPVKGRFKKIKDQLYGFSVDQTIPNGAILLIDPIPTRRWGTYYGGNLGTMVNKNACAIDASGNIIMAGGTTSVYNIATSGAYQTTLSGNSDAFLVKFSPDGQRLWGTYYGGSNGDYGYSCAVDKDNNIIFAGYSNSPSNIASPGAYQTILHGLQDGMLAKFTPGGQRVWSTYYGGNGIDPWGEEVIEVCAVDTNGNIYCSGITGSPDYIASVGAHQTTLGGKYDAFMVKFTTNGQREWGTYYGGSNLDQNGCCSVSKNGFVFLSGNTNSPNNISTPGSFMQNFNSTFKTFLVAFNLDGQRLWGTYYAGEAIDNNYGCIADTGSNVYIFGTTSSNTNISTPGAFQETMIGGGGGYLAKFNVGGLRIWGTYYGENDTYILNAAVDDSANIVICGDSHTQNNIIATPGAFQSVFRGGYYDAFLGKFNGNGQRFWGTYYGGTEMEHGMSCAVDLNENIYLCGVTYSENNTNLETSLCSRSSLSNHIATPGSFQTDHVGSSNTFLAKFSDCYSPDTALQINGPIQICANSSGNNYSIDPIHASTDYHWCVSGNLTITSGQNSTSINVSAGPVVGTDTISVYGINSCDNGFPKSMLINVLPGAVPTLTGNTTACQGENITYTTETGKTGYIWNISAGGTKTGGGTSLHDFVSVTWNTPGVQWVSVNYTETNGCSAGTATLLNVNVAAGLPVDVTITASQSQVCSGTSVTFTATPTNPGSSPGYQWKVNGVNAGTYLPVYTYTPVNGDIVTCVLTSSIVVCIANNPATSNSITMVVDSNLPVINSISPSINPACAGTSVTFTAIPTHGGITPVYQWKVNGTNFGANSPTYSYIPATSDVITCVLTSSETCTTGNPAISNPITMTVNPNLPVTVSIISSSNPFCAGSSVTFTATANNGGTPPSYQWKVNGIGVGPNNQVYSYFPNNGDVVTCVLNSNISCPTGNPATSNSITMIVNANLPAGISITATLNPFCPGSSVTFNATPINGGALPAYQWKVSGANVGTNSNTYSYNPANGDSVRCVMTSNLACVTSNPASSAKIIMSGTLSPIVTFTSCFDTITSVNAKPFKLKGGIPLGGTYSGPGVNSPTGIFTPSTAGTGTKIINYSYTNVSLCSASKSRNIIVQAAPVFVCGNNLTDIRDNKIYPSVQIGTQCWISKNLDYGMTVLSSLVQNDNCISEKYCYNDLAGNCTNFGGLYQWDEMMKYDDTQAGQGFCPPGWHVPTENEWQTLFNFYNGNGFAGRPLQDLGFSGFNALRSGVFYLNSSMSFNGFATLFWTSTSWGQFKAFSHGINTYNYSVSLYPSSRANAFPVRCLRD